jgi:hypothetical protein
MEQLILLPNVQWIRKWRKLGLLASYLEHPRNSLALAAEIHLLADSNGEEPANSYGQALSSGKYFYIVSEMADQLV